MKLAPHHVDLVEADARRLYDQAREAAGLQPRPWAEAEESTRAAFRAFAENPYSVPPRP